MHLPAKANSLSVQTFMANKSLSDSDVNMHACQYVNVKVCTVGLRVCA